MAGAAKKMAGPDLAIVFGEGGGKGGASRKPPASMGDEPMEESDEGGGEFDVAADEFLDDTLPMEDRKAALKRAIMACKGEDY
jgi:hypothetical protein